jgi:hypothetical protein
VAKSGGRAGPFSLYDLQSVERRTNPRYELWLPLEVEGLAAGVAVTHNASKNGLLIVTATAGTVGAQVRVTFCGPGERGPSLRGRIVRSGKNDADPDGVWPYALALEFDDPVPPLAELKRLAEP